jgi:sugar lactone lactonase YvrE
MDDLVARRIAAIKQPSVRSVRRLALIVLAAAAIFASSCGAHVPQGPTITLPDGARLIIVAGNGTAGYSGDGDLATEAALNAPYGLAFDSEGNLYIGQDYRISKVDIASGVITTVAGTGKRGYSGDGGPATEAQIGRVQELEFGPDGNLYFADFYYHAIRRIEANGVITTVVGTGQAGMTPDGTLATDAQLREPFGLAFDSNGSLYFSDGENHRIRVVDLDGTIVTVAGSEWPEESGDGGPATIAGLRSPRGLSFDTQGNLYIGTHGGNAIRKVDVDGVITSVPGADPGPVVVPDLTGQLYIADWAGSRIARWSPEGTFTVLLEDGLFALDNPGPDDDPSAFRIQPGGLALDAAGNIYVTDDRASHRVYRFEP